MNRPSIIEGGVTAPRRDVPTTVERRGWIFYDSQCRYCTAAARRSGPMFGRRGFEFVPLGTPWVERHLNTAPEGSADEMKVLTVTGLNLGGADALLFLAAQVWWGWPLPLLARLPGMRRLFRWGYRWFAAHRGCHRSACAVARPIQWPGWVALVGFPAIALSTRARVEPWIFMWLMAGSIFLGCKWLTFWRASQQQPDFSAIRALGYLFLWPGMDAANFLSPAPPRFGDESAIQSRRLGRSAWSPVLNVLAGVVFLFVLARLVTSPLLAGWLGMLGLVLILHFGLFHLAAIAWRMAGVNARPIMNAPIKATSLSEFWGRRWNGAFNQLLLDLFFRRLSRSLGSVRTTLIAFLVSGLIHELVISVPAGAGFGLPTSYFLLQGWGVVAQRSELGKSHGLRRGLPGWTFTMLLTAGPAFWLFHSPFVRRVILPFMQTIGAL